MKSYGVIIIEIEIFQNYIFEVKKILYVKALKKVNCLSKKFEFTAMMLKGTNPSMNYI